MKYLLTLLTFALANSLIAQTGYTKKVPVKINRYDIALYSNTDFTTDFTAKKELVNNSAKLTVDQFKRAMTMAKETNFPEGINTAKEQIDREKDIIKYVAYWQGSWLQANTSEGWAQKLNLVWIPLDENKHMPADMIPTDKDGMFFVVANLGINIDSLPKSSAPQAEFILGMKQKHNKQQAVSIDSPSNKVMPAYGTNMVFAYDALVVKGQYSDAEFARIAELTTFTYWPKPFQRTNYDDTKKQAYEDIKKYKVYQIATFNDGSKKVALYWVPKEDNLHMPAAMQPTTNEGFFIASGLENKEDPYLTFSIRGATPRGRLGYSIAGKPRPNNTSSLSTSSQSTTTKSTYSSPEVRTAANVTTTSTAIKSDGTNEGSVQHKSRKRMYITDGNTAWTMANLNNEAVAKTTLEASGLYSSRDFAQIAMLANEARYPDALSTYKVRQLNMEMTRNYNAYQVANFTTSFAPYILMWIPKSENTHMPKEMQPANDDGFYMLVQQKGVSETQQGSSMSVAQGMDNMGKSYTTSSGIQVSSADMSQFTNNSRLGVMMLYYGYGGKASSIYMYELRGKELTNKQAVVEQLTAKHAGSTFIGFEWLAGYNCDMAKGFVYKKTNSTDGTRCQGEFKID